MAHHLPVQVTARACIRAKPNKVGKLFVMRLSFMKVDSHVLENSTVWFHLMHLLLPMTFTNSIPIRTPA